LRERERERVKQLIWTTLQELVVEQRMCLEYPLV
jgi:hypothetical protein